MKITHLLIAFAAGCATTLLGAMALDSHDDNMPAMTEEEAKWMAGFMKYGTPGPEHAELAHAAGEWDCDWKMWDHPGAQPKQTEYEMEAEMILDGRYLFEHHELEIDGMDFEGFGLTGYDRMKGKWVSMWIDNMSTGIVIEYGEKKGDVLELKGKWPDYATGNYKEMRSTAEATSDDSFAFRMYAPSDNGEFLMMEILGERDDDDDDDDDNDHHGHHHNGHNHHH